MQIANTWMLIAALCLSLERGLFTYQYSMGTAKVNYAAFADFLSSYPEHVALQRFRDLNIRNLLAYQSELQYLRQELEVIEADEANRQVPPEERVNRRWTPQMANLKRPLAESGVSNPAGIDSTTGRAQTPDLIFQEIYREKMLEIRRTLAGYNEAVSHFMKQEILLSPSRSVVENLREWLARRDLGASFIKDSVEDVWKFDKDMDQLMTFTNHEGLANGLASFWVNIRRYFHFYTSEDGPSRVFSVNGSKEGSIAKGISVVASSVLPVLPIIILFFVPSLLARIGVIMAFTAVLSAVLVFGLKLEPEKVLTITTAIAAVQVVFVGRT